MDFQIVDAVQQKEGKGASVKRAFPTHNRQHINPFVLLDEFFVEQPHGFPEHPHRGFEAVTYMLDGSFIHDDTAGGSKEIHEGGAQRVNMGSGVKHSEEPGSEGTNHGLQLWINLPEAKKDMDPDYQDAEQDEIRADTGDGWTVNDIIGKGPITVQATVEYLIIEFDGGSFTWNKNSEDWNGFIYVIDGSGTIDGRDIQEGQLAVFEGGSVEVEIESEDMTVAAVKGERQDQTIDHHGPYVD